MRNPIAWLWRLLRPRRRERDPVHARYMRRLHRKTKRRLWNGERRF